MRHRLGLGVADLDSVFLHVALDLLSKSLQLLVLLLELFFFGLEHRDHVETNLHFLFSAQFDLARCVLLRCVRFILLLLGLDHAIEGTLGVGEVLTQQKGQFALLRVHQLFLALLQLGIPVNAGFTLLGFFKDVLVLYYQLEVLDLRNASYCHSTVLGVLGERTERRELLVFQPIDGTLLAAQAFLAKC